MVELPAPEDWYALPAIEVEEGEPTVARVLSLGRMIAFDDRSEASEREAEARAREREGEPELPEELLATATILSSTGPKLARLPRELVSWALSRNGAWEFGWERRFPGNVLFNRIDGKVEATVMDEP